MTRRMIATLTASFLVLCGCQNEANETDSTLKSDFAAPSITEFHNLGWIGAMGHPLMESVSFKDPNASEESISPGGIVVRNVVANAPAAAAGLKIGDVIVGVAGEWLPINDNPTFDLIELIESQIDQKNATADVHVLRNGTCQTVSVIIDRASLNDGLPDQVQRYSTSASNGLAHLASLQNADGDFGDSAATFDAKVQTTSLAGLSFLASGDKRFKQNVEQCATFIGQQIDTLIAASKVSDASNPKPDLPRKPTGAPSGMMIMQPTSFDMAPLTAAYTLAFLAESDIPLMSKDWMQRMMGLLGSLTKSQHKSGGWNVSENLAEGTIDVAGTHTTNQALLAIGMIERKGMMAQPELIQRACKFLKAQSDARASQPLDRRLKTTLTAGTAAALVSINCQQTDPTLRQAISDGLNQTTLQLNSPSLTLPGVLSIATLARQTSNENWNSFHTAVKYWITSVQLPDGSFNSPPNADAQSMKIESQDADPAWIAAHYCLILSMQSAHLEKLTAQTKSPMMVARDSSGKKSDGNSDTHVGGPPQMGPGTKMFRLDDLSGEGSIEDQIKEKLKEMGLPTDNVQIQGLPGKKEKKDDGKDD